MNLTNSLETVINETKNIGLDRELAKERYISPEKRQKLIDDVRLILEYQKMITLLNNT